MSSHSAGDSANGAGGSGTTAGDAVASASPSSLNYVPYQRRSHARNASTLSQVSVSSAPRSEAPKATGTSGTSPAAVPPVAAPAASSSPGPQNSTSIARLGTMAAPTPPASHTGGSQQHSSIPPRGLPVSPVPSGPRSSNPAPPLVRIGSGAAARNLPAPPPLRSASALRKETPASPDSPAASSKVAGKQPEKPSLPRQPSAGTIALGQRRSSNASSAPSPVDVGQRQSPASHGRSPSSAMLNSPKPDRDPRLSHARLAGPRASTNLETSSAGSSRSSPLNSGAATPRLGSGNISVPAHVHSYAALLAAQSKLGPIPVPQGVAIANVVGQHQQQNGEGGQGGANGFNRLANGRSTAYRPGFQPRGAYRVRTDEFVEARRKRRSEGEMEQQRMERRLAKLITIHFAPQEVDEHGEKGPALPRLDFDLGELRRDPGSVLKRGGSDLWSSLRARTRGEDLVKRAAEQSIVNWQDDAEVKACPICSTAFSLTVRKHHCRLCGRVVCASPHLSRPAWPEAVGAPGDATQPMPLVEQRKQLERKCSSLIVADPVTGKIEDARDAAGLAKGAADGKADRAASEKGVRICRDCKDVIRKRQYMIDDGTVPAYLKLYEALMQVQKDIEESLPEFQEMVLGLQKHDHTAALGSSAKANIELQRDAAQARKQLLANFATYDELAKRIRKLPAPASEGGGGSSDAAQERVQQAIWTKANLFLQQNMLPLRSLPKPGSKKPSSTAGSDEGAEAKTKAKRPTGGPPRRGNQARGGSVSSMASFQTWLGGKGRQSNGGGGEAMTLAEASRLQADERFDEGDDDDDDDYGGDDDDGPVDVAALEEQLGVLLEQERLVSGYVESASRARKFDDARTLKASHDDLCREILRMQRKLVVKGQGRAGAAAASASAAG
ncbi:uncharacterized protein PFL1_02862 [Pseudozyma flocculosa PF-1]|uniref:Related to vacuolar segregation protein PEP7 n=2 Tax=Pseudozyma flocculosa TaxID=84751 RepID=A0A5C3F434_9BASI|nr:uncharacterized protein PFL1_02862 [Pseudozyma flocculosa PF-1]EPQ29642.1 hypothetical protein PFL1_02862 [Pseudozyma flocculosa PF-1]SPO38209.1 related to vacuolar segregation protein PEP7 [Pseudozyma flocculosa]